jgi:DNA-binding phage protein
MQAVLRMKKGAGAMVFSRKNMDRHIRAKSMTWAEAARLAGLSQNGFWQMMRGYREPKVSTISTLCRALDLSFFDAFEDEGDGGGSNGAA